MGPPAGRGRQPQAEMHAALVVELLGQLAANGIAVWLDGGWGVDALLGTPTRRHDDLDLVAGLDDAAGIETALGQRGYLLAGGGTPTSFELVDAHGHQVDVHPVAFTASGDGLYRMGNGEDWLFPAHGFAGVGRVLGQDVQCLTPDVMLVCHTTGYALDQAHQRDVEALAERFSIPVPAFVRAD